MCQSQIVGGLRCAAHTGPRFLAAPPSTREWDNAAAEYASTPTGAARLATLHAEAVANGDIKQEIAYSNALRAGARIKERAEAVREAMRRPTRGPHPTPGTRPHLTLIHGGTPAPTDDDEDTYCDWCGTDPGPHGRCDCPPPRTTPPMSRR